MDKLDLEAIDCARTQLGIDRTHAFACMVSPCTCSANAEDQRDMEAIARLTTLKRRLQSLPQGWDGGIVASERPESSDRGHHQATQGEGPENPPLDPDFLTQVLGWMVAVDQFVGQASPNWAKIGKKYADRLSAGIRAMEKAEAQGTARIQEADNQAPGVRECWVKFVDGAPWAVNIRPYHYMENCEWVHMVEADKQAPKGQKEGEA